MDDEIRTLRSVLAGMKRGQGRRYPTEMKHQIRRVAQARRARGESWQAIAKAIGIPHETLRRFAAECDGVAGNSAGAFVPVQLTATPTSPIALVLTTRAGIRVEGLDIDGVVELVRRLS